MWQVGVGPFMDGLRLAKPWALAAALVITSAITLCCAWRWSLVAGGLGIDVRLGPAVGACYRSEFLNATLPGGVLGDVHRGVRHGRGADDLGRGLRSVAWERASGQAVQVVLTVAVLLLLAWPAGSLRVAAAGAGIAVAGVALGVVVVLQRTKGGGGDGEGPVLAPPRRPARLARIVTSDLREAVLTRRALPGIVLASTLAVLGHVAVFAVALQATGAEVPAGRLLPLALLVLLAATLPTNIAGWGPREGAAAWAFGAVGLGAAQGVTVAVVYGVLALVATLPGAVLLVADHRAGSRHRIDRPAPEVESKLPEARPQPAGGVAHA